MIAIKIIVLGDSGVGKTSLLCRYCLGYYENVQQPTIGCDFQVKNVQATDSQVTYKLQLWDIAGQERFLAISKLYVRGAAGAVIVTDINNKDCYQQALKWKQLIKQNCDQFQNGPIPIILVQNKTDLIENKDVLEQIKQQTQQLQIDKQFINSIQCSVKNNINIHQIFQNLVDEINKRNQVIHQYQFDNVLNYCDTSQFNYTLNSKNQFKQKSSCC